MCYFGALPRCCANMEKGFEVGKGITVMVGSEQVTVRYFYLGGFGFDDPLSKCACIIICTHPVHACACVPGKLQQTCIANVA